MLLSLMSLAPGTPRPSELDFFLSLLHHFQSGWALKWASLTWEQETRLHEIICKKHKKTHQTFLCFFKNSEEHLFQTYLKPYNALPNSFWVNLTMKNTWKCYIIVLGQQKNKTLETSKCGIFNSWSEGRSGESIHIHQNTWKAKSWYFCFSFGPRAYHHSPRILLTVLLSWFGCRWCTKARWRLLKIMNAFIGRRMWSFSLYQEGIE